MNHITTNRLRRFIFDHDLKLTFGIGLFMILVCLVFRGQVIGKPVNIDTHKIKSSINTCFAHTNSICEQWLNSTNDSLFVRNLWKIETPPAWDSRDMTLLLYKKNELKLWSNYNFTNNVDPLKIIPTPYITECEGNKLLTKHYENGEKTAIVILRLFNTETGLNKAIFADTRLNITPSGSIDIDNKFKIEPKLRHELTLSIITLFWLGLLLTILGLKLIFRRQTKRHNSFTVNFIFMGLLIMIGVWLTSVDLPFNQTEIFDIILFSIGDTAISVGKLLICFTLFLIYTIYLYCIRYKLSYRYKQLKRISQFFLLIAMLIFINLSVISFHFSMMKIVYHTSVNIELYRFTLMSVSSIIFYIICGYFISARLLINAVTRTIFHKQNRLSLVVWSIIILIVMILPIESAIGDSGYILIVFHILFLLVTVYGYKFKERYSFQLTIIIFSIYVMLFAIIESNVVDSKNAKIYAIKLAYEAPLTDETVEKYQKFTYYKITNNKIELKDNNSIGLQELNDIIKIGKDTVLYADGYLHCLKYSHKDRIIVVSRQAITLLDYMSFFASIYLLLNVLVMLLLKLTNYRYNYETYKSRFALHIRLTIVGVVIMTMILVIVVLTITTFTSYDAAKRKMVNNETQLMLRGFESYAKNSDKPTNKNMLLDWFKTDDEIKGKNVQIYDADGNYVASPKQLQAYAKINSRAYSALYWNNAPLYNNQIEYKTKTYNSAYLPIYHTDTLLGYVNLIQLDRVNNMAVDPRFDILVNTFNILIIVVLLAILISMALYRVLIIPLGRLHQGIGNIAAMRHIEESDSEDEIAVLIKQYNRMIDYLEQSYQALARSEREGAWREMARQVAHEIKNPLTPMKLKIQILQRARAQASPDTEQRTTDTLNLLLEQIDLLARIATEFSDFARMSDTRVEHLNVRDIIAHIHHLYVDNTDAKFTTEIAPIPMIVKADRAQLTRVLINIYQNAIQATANKDDAHIHIEASNSDGMVVIKIVDNGTGISDESKKQMFVPHFTTKSTGSGLGLAISRQIIIGIGGTIEFESTHGQGSTFTIKLPQL